MRNNKAAICILLFFLFPTLPASAAPNCYQERKAKPSGDHHPASKAIPIGKAVEKDSRNLAALDRNAFGKNSDTWSSWTYLTALRGKSWSTTRMVQVEDKLVASATSFYLRDTTPSWKGELKKSGLDVDKPSLYIATLATHKEHQGHGYGTALISDVQAEARQNNIPVLLHVAKSNMVAISLYEKLGFQTVKEVGIGVSSTTEGAYLMMWRPETTDRQRTVY